MDKRYQIFVSSTYTDLKEERQKVLQTLMEMDCIPSGMELFPAADEEQWEFIKKVIDDCDYYLLIVGGRYGSTTDEGISYTEKEYDYAVEKGIKVIAFLHGKPGEISRSKSDINPEMLEKLEVFRKKVGNNRLVKFWTDATELPGLVALSLTKTIKMYPAVGWIRANKATSTEVLSEINELRKENDKLRQELKSKSKIEKFCIEDIAKLDDVIIINGTVCKYLDGSRRGTSTSNWSIKTSWREIFSVLSPYLLEYPSDDIVKLRLGKNTFPKNESTRIASYKVEDQSFQTVKIQMIALGLVDIKCLKTTKGSMALFWNITDKGRKLMMQLRTVRKAN